MIADRDGSFESKHVADGGAVKKAVITRLVRSQPLTVKLYFTC